MKNLKFLVKELNKNNIEYEYIEYIENKNPTYWVDLKITFQDTDWFKIIRLPAYSKRDYKINNYNKIIIEEVQKLRQKITEIKEAKKCTIKKLSITNMNMN